MTEVDKYEPGSFSWVDLQTTDAESGKRFYTELFGWELEDMPAGDMGVYTMFRLRGRDVAALSGMGPQFEGIPPHWNSYVTVDDVDACAKSAADLGGNVMMEPADVMDSGRMAAVQDPSGGVVMLWEPRNHIGAGIRDEPGSLTWIELLTRDIEAAKRFYTKLFGWGTESMDMGDMDTGDPYTVFTRGDQTAGGLFRLGEDMRDVPPNWSVCFAIDDIDPTVSRAEELGGRIIVPPMDIPKVGRYATLADPQGAVFSLLQPPEQP
ncbi:MAG: VOC family protein [Actinomycetota bacterium]|nr:VOC family protein [Actinomycetota bacterium]